MVSVFVSHSSLVMSTPAQPSRHGKPLSEETRRRIVYLVFEKKRTRTAVAEALGVHRNTVYNIIELFHRTGGYRTQYGNGPPMRYSNEQLERLWDIILETPRLTARALIRAMGDDGPPISERTMRRYRLIVGMTPRTGRIVASAMLGNHEQRWDWAWENRRRPVAMWLHSDESTLCMRDTGDVVWWPKGLPPPHLEVSKLRSAIHIWDVVWNKDRIFRIYDGHLTASKYMDLLEENILSEKENLAGRVYLLDRHPAHTAKATQRWLARHNLEYKLLPTHSPQFNAIEMCWAWIKDRVRELGPDSPEMLRAHLESAFDAIRQQHIRNYLQHAQDNVRAYRGASREH